MKRVKMVFTMLRGRRGCFKFFFRGEKLLTGEGSVVPGGILLCAKVVAMS